MNLEPNLTHTRTQKQFLMKSPEFNNVKSSIIMVVEFQLKEMMFRRYLYEIEHPKSIF